MATVRYIDFFKSGSIKKVMSVAVEFKHGGTDTMKVEVPEKFYDCVIAIAQAAADAAEQKIIANVLAEKGINSDPK